VGEGIVLAVELAVGLARGLGGLAAVAARAMAAALISLEWA
jgi:hypothetical protein